jgi:hypothetical protein
VDLQAVEEESAEDRATDSRRSSPAWMCMPPRSRVPRMVPQRRSPAWILQAYDECAGQDPDAFEDLQTAKDGDVRITDLRSRAGEG